MADTLTLKEIRETIMGRAGLLFSPVVATTIGTASYTINELADLSPDPFRMRDSFLYKPTAEEFRRILSFGYPTNNNVVLSREFTAAATISPAQIYFLLDPPECNRTISEAHQSLYTIERTSISLVANQNEYAIANALHTKTQVLNILYRYTVGGADIYETAAPAFKLIEDDNVVTLHLITNEQTPAVANTSVVVVWRKYYGALATDAATTTCPRELILPKAEMALFKKLFKRHGDAAKRIFGQDLSIAEKDFMEARELIIAPSEARELHISEPVELPYVLPRTWSW